MRLPQALRPDWPAPAHVSALMSTRSGGVSAAPFDSLNLRPPALGGAGADKPESVFQNQRDFSQALGAVPVWLNQVHGATVVTLTAADLQAGRELPQADASISREPGLACAVLVADCLPLLLCSADGLAVGAVHAGWRGLAAGVIDQSVSALCKLAGCSADQLLAWLGPCIGPQAFEVGEDVLQAFGVDPHRPDELMFRRNPRPDGSLRWRADLAGLARRRLAMLGVRQISGGTWCTVSDASRFFSFRRDGHTGRMAAAVAVQG